MLNLWSIKLLFEIVTVTSSVRGDVFEDIGDFVYCGVWGEIDCEYDSWQDWGSCSRTCGPHGVKSRARTVKQMMACEGEPCYTEDLTSEESCNLICLNGVYSSSQCACPDEYHDECCGTRK